MALPDYPDEWDEVRYPLEEQCDAAWRRWAEHRSACIPCNAVFALFSNGLKAADNNAEMCPEGADIWIEVVESEHLSKVEGALLRSTP